MTLMHVVPINIGFSLKPGPLFGTHEPPLLTFKPPLPSMLGTRHKPPILN